MSTWLNGQQHAAYVKGLQEQNNIALRAYQIERPKADNEQLRAEIERLRADSERLRTLVANNIPWAD